MCSNAVSIDSIDTNNAQDIEHTCDPINVSIRSDSSEENAEVKECTNERSIDVSKPSENETCKESGIRVPNSEILMHVEVSKFENLNSKDDSKQPIPIGCNVMCLTAVSTDIEQTCEEPINGGISSEASEEIVEVKECTNERSVDVFKPSENETFNESGIPVLDPEISVHREETKLENLKSKDDCMQPIATEKCTRRSASGNSKTKCTVPQPFALATAKHATFVTRSVTTESDNSIIINKKIVKTNSQYSSTAKENQFVSDLVQRKPLQLNNKKHPDEEDCCSVASSIASNRKSRRTIALAPVFRSSQRAERRKEFYSKLEEKHQALEAEKVQCQERTKEECEMAIKQFRKSLLFRANPMPSFYHEEQPPKMELKKPPPTRAKSPKLGRKKSLSNAIGSEKGITASSGDSYHVLNIYQDGHIVASKDMRY